VHPRATRVRAGSDTDRTERDGDSGTTVRPVADGGRTLATGVVLVDDGVDTVRRERARAVTNGDATVGGRKTARSGPRIRVYPNFSNGCSQPLQKCIDRQRPGPFGCSRTVSVEPQ
jgi:hypothetical protein